jgi:hypothetical protein
MLMLFDVIYGVDINMLVPFAVYGLLKLIKKLPLASVSVYE